MGLSESASVDLDRLCDELFLRGTGCYLRCNSSSALLTNDAGFHAIFGLAPRIAAASFVAFIIGSFANAYVMSVMKIRDGGKHFSARAILSTIAGESCDSLIFFPLALGGVVPASELPWLMLWQVILKTAYEIVVLPLTIRVVKYVKKHEGEDAYDNNISYNVFKIFSLG